MNKKQRHIFWPVFLLLCLLTVALSASITYWRHTVPLSQCSEVYRQYRDMPGIQASFVKDKQINDTLFLDMTLFEAEDSAAFANLLRTIGKSDEFIYDMTVLREQYITRKNANEIRFSGSCLRGHPEQQADSDLSKNEILSIFPVRRCIVVFNTQSELDLQTVMDKSYFDEININK